MESINSHNEIAIAHSIDGNYTQAGFEVTDRVTMIATDASNFRQPRSFSAHVVALGLERCHEWNLAWLSLVVCWTKSVGSVTCAVLVICCNPHAIDSCGVFSGIGRLEMAEVRFPAKVREQ